MKQLIDMIRHRWVYALGIAALIFLAVFALVPQPVSVEVATIDRGTVRASLLDEGRTRMREVYVVSAPVSGRLLRVAVEPGDRVQKNEPLARMTRGASSFLDPRSDAEARAIVAAAEARERAAVAERELAEIEEARAQKLAEARLIAEADRDTARVRLRAARAAEAAAAAELRRARSALLAAGQDGSRGTVSLQAPASGTVLSVPQESETVIAAGTPVVILGDPSRVDIVADFLSQDAVRMKPGDRAFIENWGERGSATSDAIAAVVERVEPVARTKVSALGIEEQRTRVILNFIDPPPDALKAHDFRVDVRVIVAEARDAVRVPVGALFRDGDGWAVYVVESGRARSRPVQVGEQDDQYREIRSGLAAGERVVSFPGAEVRDGVTVKALF
ncbi:MAG: efflux RND transporter periplasmic adaptor subunit [Steroidobacteraceae bacterium]